MLLTLPPTGQPPTAKDCLTPNVSSEQTASHYTNEWWLLCDCCFSKKLEHSLAICRPADEDQGGGDKVLNQVEGDFLLQICPAGQVRREPQPVSGSPPLYQLPTLLVVSNSTEPPSTTAWKVWAHSHTTWRPWLSAPPE